MYLIIGLILSLSVYILMLLNAPIVGYPIIILGLIYGLIIYNKSPNDSSNSKNNIKITLIPFLVSLSLFFPKLIYREKGIVELTFCLVILLSSLILFEFNIENKISLGNLDRKIVLISLMLSFIGMGISYAYLGYPLDFQI